MQSTWRDGLVQAEINRERTRNGEIHPILRVQRSSDNRSINGWVIQFGSWLERVR